MGVFKEECHEFEFLERNQPPLGYLTNLANDAAPLNQLRVWMSNMKNMRPYPFRVYGDTREDVYFIGWEMDGPYVNGQTFKITTRKLKDGKSVRLESFPQQLFHEELKKESWAEEKVAKSKIGQYDNSYNMTGCMGYNIGFDHDGHMRDL